MAAKRTSATVTSTGLPADYPLFLESLKSRVQQSQTKAMLSVNRELIQLYWDIGRQIAQRQNLEGWGRSTVERLAADLQNAFPGIQGFSRTNIFRMRAFFLAYSNAEVVPQAVGQLNDEAIVAQPVGQFEVTPPEVVLNLPWGHNCVLIEKLKEHGSRNWYAAKTLGSGVALYGSYASELPIQKPVFGSLILTHIFLSCSPRPGLAILS